MSRTSLQAICLRLAAASAAFALLSSCNKVEDLLREPDCNARRVRRQPDHGGHAGRERS